MPTFCFIYLHLDLWMERAFCSHAIICKQKNEVKITDTIPLVYPRLWHFFFILSQDCECHRCPLLVASALTCLTLASSVHGCSTPNRKAFPAPTCCLPSVHWYDKRKQNWNSCMHMFKAWNTDCHEKLLTRCQPRSYTTTIKTSLS